MRIAVQTEVTPELVAAFERMIPQLSRSSPPPSTDQLSAIVSCDACHLLIARDDDGAIVGTLTLVVFPIPTAIRAWIEDVIVDRPAVEGRGLGVGEKLNRFAVELARSLGAKTVDLTSRPSREHANMLYRRMGFEPRETNVYRYDLK